MYIINGLPFTSEEVENGRKSLLDILLRLKQFDSEGPYIKYDTYKEYCDKCPVVMDN